MTFYPSKLLDTREQTIGTNFKWLRRLALLACAASGAVFHYVSPLGGFALLLVASIAYQVILGREWYIDSLYKIRAVTDLRLRLLTFQDSEYALESLAKDSVWRGEPVDPEVTTRLSEIRKEKEEVKEKLENFLTELRKSFAEPVTNTVKDEEKKPN